MNPIFELVETAPRPSPALRTALLAIEALRRQTCLAEVVVDECRTQFPAVAALDNVGPVGDRLREHLEAYADHEAILRWMKEADWPYPPDLTWAKKSRKRAWIRLRKAARRLEPLVHPPPAVPTPSPPVAPLVGPIGHGRATLPIAYWPKERWLELYGLFKQLPPQARPTRHLFDVRGQADLWDWVDALTSHSPTHDAHPWRVFVAPGITVALAHQLLPAWVGIMGRAPVDAETAAFALGEVGMAPLIDELRHKWDEALKVNAPRVARAALTLWPAHGSWWGLILKITEWRRAVVAENDGLPVRDPGR